MWQRRRVLMALLALGSVPALAQPSPSPIDALMRRLAAVSASRASFTEEKTIAARFLRVISLCVRRARLQRRSRTGERE